MSLRFLRLIALSVFVLIASAPTRAQDLPFGDGFLPTLSYSESYLDTVVLGDFGFEQVATGSMSINLRVSMKDVVVEELIADGNSLAFSAGNLQLDLSLSDAELTESGGYQIYTWRLLSINPSTGEEFESATIELKFNDAELRVAMSFSGAPGDYSLYATQQAGLEEEIEDAAQVFDFSIGPYGLEQSLLYISGTSSVFDKTVGTGDEQQEFFGLAKVNLTGLMDSVLPLVTVDSPTHNARWNQRPATIHGKATDRFGIARVEVQISNFPLETPSTDPWVPTSVGLDTWSLSGVNFTAGKVRIRARSIDQNGLVSKVFARDFFFSSVSDLTVTAEGTAPGRITSGFFAPLVFDPAQPAPSSVTQQPEGKSLVVTAVPAVGSVFDGWTSDKTLTDKQKASARLSFKHFPNMTVTARFIPNPFIPVKGRYNGLASGAMPASNGFLVVTLAPNGNFTGSLKAGTITLKLKGKFSNTGRYTRTVTVGGVPYVIDLTLNVSGTGTQQITGTVQGGNVDVTIQAERVVFDRRINPAPQAGTYNVIIPPLAGQPADYPAGIGFGRVTVSPAGAVRIAGRTGTTPAFNASARLTGTGTWPFFGSLYGRRGSLSGIIAFDLANPAHDLTGTLNWFRPPGVVTIPVHSGGFTGQSTLIGAKYTPPPLGQRVFLEASTGAGKFISSAPADATLAALVATFDVALGTNNRFTVTPSASAPIGTPLITLNPLTGQFFGSFTEGASTLRYSGILAGQKLNRGAGFFRRGTVTGAVEIVAP